MRIAVFDGGGGGDPGWAAFELAFRAQLEAWVALDDARNAGASPAVIGERLDDLSAARDVARAARHRLGHA